MTDAEHVKQKSRLDKLRRKWIPILGLSDWEIDFVGHRASPIADNNDLVCSGWARLATAEVHWEYKRATLRFDLRVLGDYNDTQVENTFVHECCHVIVNEMREWSPKEGMDSDLVKGCMNHEERVVTELTKAFIKTFGAGARSGKQASERKVSGKVKNG